MAAAVSLHQSYTDCSTQASVYAAGASFGSLVFLPRGAYILEILPLGTQHSPLYPSLAARTGKEFARYVNDDPSLQHCRHPHTGDAVVGEHCEGRYSELQVNTRIFSWWPCLAGVSILAHSWRLQLLWQT